MIVVTKMIENQLRHQALMSNCTKQKVGCLITDKDFNTLTVGNNYIPSGCNEFDEEGKTSKDVVHAEIDAINKYLLLPHADRRAKFIFITKKPCNTCACHIDYFIEDKDHEVRIIEFDDLTKQSEHNFSPYKLWTIPKLHKDKFNKFDSDKIKPHLLTKSMREAVIKVLSFGANKYGERNYLLAKDRQRYTNALERHLMDYIQDPKSLDGDSGMPHLWHIACNVMILIECEEHGELET